MLGVLVAFFFGSLREYRRRQWRGAGDHWMSTCSTELSTRARIDVRSSGRVCECLFDYISVRWTPEQYAADRQGIERSLLEQRVQDGCLDWAGGWSNRRP